MRVVAVVPARSGSQGVPDKNIRPIQGQSLLARAIAFGNTLPVDSVVVTTDSAEYAEMAREEGAITPGLRSSEASSATAMEPAVIDDLNLKIHEYGLDIPDVVVWLRPTFVFRSLEATKSCIRMVVEDGRSAARVVTEVDARVYSEKRGTLVPNFDDQGASMIRRQGMMPLYHVFNVDVFPWPRSKCPIDYLGRDVGFAVAPKLCSIDIDTEEDAEIAEALLEHFGNGILP